MTTKTLNEHIVMTPGVLGGRPRIAGRRIGVEHIVRWHDQMGWSVEYIASEFDLSLADVHAALVYYYDHKDEVDTRMREDAAFVEEMMRNAPSLVAQKLARMGGIPTPDGHLIPATSAKQLPWWGRTIGSFRGQNDKVLY